MDHSLAQAYEQKGEINNAIKVLELASLQKPITIFETGATYMWQRNQFYLRRLYLSEGQGGAAQRVQEELQQVLLIADPGHPLLSFESDSSD